MRKASRYHGPDPWGNAKPASGDRRGGLRTFAIIALAAGLGLLLGGISAFA